MTFEYRDEFERKRIAEQIVKLLMDDQFSPMVLDGDWGVGKTEFCHKLINLIRSDQNKEGETNKNIPRCQCLYIDAFAEDHGDDPLLMLLGNIARFIKNKEGNGDTFERYQKWKSASLAVAKSCLKIGAKAAIGVLLKQNADSIGEEVSDAIKKSAEEGVDAIVNASLQQYEESNSNIEALKSILAELARDERLIIVVDELDRCRPDFSITLLEKIKHVFEVPNVSFLLVSNMRQLGTAISHVYGNGSDISRYMDKFVKLVVSLPTYYDRKISVAWRYFDTLMRCGKMPGMFDAPALRFIKHILETNSHSLRDVEHFSRYCKVLNIFLLGHWMFRDYTYVQILAVMATYCCCFKRDFVKTCGVNDIDVEFLVDVFNLKDVKNGSILYEFRNIVECLDSTIDSKTGFGNRKFTINKDPIFDARTDIGFDGVRRIFIDFIMNLSLVRI